MDIILCVLFFIVIADVTLYFLFFRKENLLTAKTRLAYTGCIVTLVSSLIYSFFFGQNSGFPEYIRTLGILSVISVIVLMAGVFIKEVGVEQVIPEDMDKKSNAKIFLTIFGVAIASRLIIYFIGYLYSIQALNLKAGFLEGFNSMWNKWDTVHYLNLAQNGYTASGENAKLIVFLSPLFPFSRYSCKDNWQLLVGRCNCIRFIPGDRLFLFIQACQG